MYKESLQSWDQVHLLLKGIWHDANVSLDLIQLHLEILHLKDTKPLQLNATKACSEWLEQLRKTVPSREVFVYSFALFGTCLGCCNGFRIIPVITCG